MIERNDFWLWWKYAVVQSTRNNSCVTCQYRCRESAKSCLITTWDCSALIHMISTNCHHYNSISHSEYSTHHSWKWIHIFFDTFDFMWNCYELVIDWWSNCLKLKVPIRTRTFFFIYEPLHRYDIPLLEMLLWCVTLIPASKFYTLTKQSIIWVYSLTDMCLTKSAIHSKRTPLMSPLFCTHQQPWCDTLSRCTLPSHNWVWVSSARKAKAHPNYILNGNIFSALSSTLQTTTHAQYILLLPIKNIYRLLHIQRNTM